MHPLIRIFLPAFFLALTFNAVGQHIDSNRTCAKAQQALRFGRQRGYNTQYCILIDMGLASGVKRFMVWDLNEML